jgi:L-rhamnose 1-dehydrogenase
MTQNRLSDPAQMAWSIGRIPLGRIAEPEDIAGPVGFLCSSEAAYVTGATLVCDGGWMIAA